jgi:hypothetical protein
MSQKGDGLEEMQSVPCSVILNKVLGVESTFVIKNHLPLFPKRPLQAVLAARYPDRPAQHWLVMTTQIYGVQLIALAYAWSHSSTSFLSLL